MQKKNHKALPIAAFFVVAAAAGLFIWLTRKSLAYPINTDL
jgi:hypothetical protein